MIVLLIFIIMFCICSIYTYQYLKPWILYVEHENT
ncbi:CRPV-153 [Crowpox virus]|nr:CRPV-153 [Crowpox virus]